MTSSERQVVEAALRILEAEGFDVKMLWRELGDRALARIRAEEEPAPLSSLDLNLDAVLLASSDPLLVLRQRGAALTKEIERLSLEFDREEAKKQSISLSRAERKAISLRLACLKDELAARKAAQREVLVRTRDFAEKERLKESAKVYDAMRISKLGVRGEKHISD